jgi:hypothetical protein
MEEEIAVYRIRAGLGCAYLRDGKVENLFRCSDFKKIDSAFSDIVRSMKEIYGNNLPVVSMIPESERDEYENPQLLTDTEYRELLKQLEME